MSDNSKKIFWVVGEASGDIHAAHLIEEIKKTSPKWEHCGMTGSSMENAGVQSYADISEASVMGLVEVIAALPKILKLRNRLIRTIERIRPELVILVDFPDFNLNLLKKLRQSLGNSIKIVYFVSPQIWAWRKGRAKTMSKLLDAIIVLFPFEVDFYKKYGLEAVCFGHPMVGETGPSLPKDEVVKQIGFDPDKKIVALLPGSRKHEIEKHLTVQIEALKILCERVGKFKAVIVKAPTVDQATLDEYVAGNDVWLKVSDLSSSDILSVSHAAIVKSGTSTVEASFSGVPFVVMYIVNNFTFKLAKLLVRGVDFIAMINVIAGKEVVKELIQDEATPSEIALSLEQIWSGEQRNKTINELGETSQKLGEPGALKRTADWLHNRFLNE